MKRIFTAAAATFLCLTLILTGCGNTGKTGTTATTETTKVPANLNVTGMPIVKEKVSLKFASLRGAANTVSYAEMPVIKDLETLTSVQIVWDEIDNSAKNEKVNLMFASNTLPDAFYGPLLTDAQVVNFSASKTLVPLDNLINSYGPNLKSFMEKRPDYKKTITTPDGHIYSLASLIEEERTLAPDNMFINKVWLDKLGLKVPETSDEFYAALKAFRDGDPNGNGKKDEIPFSYSEKYHSIYSLFGMFGLADTTTPTEKSHLAVKNGKVIYNLAQTEYKDGLNYFSKMFMEGLVDQEAFTQETAQLKAKGSSATPILGSVMAFWLDDIMPKDRQADYVHLKPMKGPKGDQLWVRRQYLPGVTKNTFSITSANKNPEVTMRWIDYSMDDGDKSNTITHGLIDKGWKYEDKAAGTWRTLNEQFPAGMTFAQYRHSMAPGANAVYLLSSTYTNKRVLDAQNTAQQNRFLVKKPFLVPQDRVLPYLYLTAEEQTEVSTLATDISSYAEQFRAESLTKGKINEQWDAYLGKLKTLKLDRLLEIYQKANERVK